MPAMLRHKPTGDMYIFTELLSRRDDMEFVDVPDIKPVQESVVIAASEPKPKRTTKPVPSSVDSIIDAVFPKG